jgi:hypothetical protein
MGKQKAIMRNQLFLALFILSVLFASSCKKDDEGDKTQDTTCTETREFWMDGTLNGEAFETSVPCGNLRLSEDAVSQQSQGGTDIFTFTSNQTMKDSLNYGLGAFAVTVSTIVPSQLIDTTVNSGDTSYAVSANNVCNIMKLGKHYLFLSEAQQNNANAFFVNYIDSNGASWTPIVNAVNDSSFVVTSIDGIVSQSPFSGAYLPYCAIQFSYDLLLQQQPPADTLRLKGTGRLGFR